MKLILTLLALFASVNAFQDCLFNRVDNWEYVPIGFAYGMKGSRIRTDCSTATIELMRRILLVFRKLEDIFSNVLEPYQAISNAIIAGSNVQTSCSANAQSTQFDLRTTTTGGISDLLYTVTQFPIEGFFMAQSQPDIKNQIWDSVYDHW